MHLLNAFLTNAEAKVGVTHFTPPNHSPEATELLCEFEVLAIHTDLIETIKHLCANQVHQAFRSYCVWYENRTPTKQIK